MGKKKDKNAVIFPARVKLDKGGQLVVQTVETHCKNTAKLAQECLCSVGLGNTAYLAGLLHDCGKFTQSFSEYVCREGNGVDVKRCPANHTFAGVKFLLDNYYQKNGAGGSFVNNVTCEILCYVIGSHHGLLDFIDDDKKSALLSIQNKRNICYKEAVVNMHTYLASKDEIDKLYRAALEEVRVYLDNFKSISRDVEELTFYIGLMCRMVLSAVIEGDRTDIAAFIGCVDKTDMSVSCDWNTVSSVVEKEVDNFLGDTEAEKTRKIIADRCYDGAVKSPGIYRLNIPVNGGRTLASLRYALRHSCLFNKKRIIYVMPLLSDIEQNVAVIKKLVQDDSIVFEHHSNVVEASEGEAFDKREFLLETWNAPIIVTTLVQMLNTMFKDRLMFVRRFRSLCDSIIIFDDVQTVPLKLLSLFNLMCNFLSKACNCTIILCSDVQPNLGKIKHAITKDISDLIVLDKDILKHLQRTVLVDLGMMDIPGVIAFGKKILQEQQSLLIICNTKAETSDIYEGLAVEGVEKFYLSANMCREHRKVVVQDIKDKLLKKKRLVCVSTQAIEAGGDISFASVIRLKAGMDSIIRATGYCNRHEEFDGKAPVYIVDLIGENLAMLPDIKNAKNATTSLFVERGLNPELHDLMSEPAIDFYYTRLYKMYALKAGYHDFYCKKGNFYILDKLSANSRLCVYNKSFLLSQAFRTAGRAFEVFEFETQDVLVPYKEGKNIIADLCSERARRDFNYAKERLKIARGYTVGLYGYQIDKLAKIGVLKENRELGLYVLTVYEESSSSKGVDV